MARREWNVARNGQFGRLAKSAGFRRNPQEHVGTGAIGQKKSQPMRVGILSIWWSWRELNPRPQAFFVRFYMRSQLI